MEPTSIAYDISRCYTEDQNDVDPALISKVDGFRRSRNLAGLASCSCHFDWQRHTINDWRYLRQTEAFFKKNSAFSEPTVCRKTAEASFFKAEQQCQATNDRLDFYYIKRDLLDPDLNSQMLRMERYIRNVLGDFNRFIVDLPSMIRVTPGATAHSARRYSLPQMKMRMKLYATHRTSKYLRALYRFHGFNVPKIREVSSNRIELVPKNWKTDRTIACEPEGNLPLQLAFDRYAKRRLRRVGIDLSNQSANQRAAKHGSIYNDLVTVDFAAASDTISYNAVAWAFPHDWFNYLCDVRTPNYRGCFGEGTYHKFSSMGNGSTFTIETLLFAAACYAVGSRNFLVYGDDVVLEKEHYEKYIRLTRFLGFTVNEEKSFSEGPFRESCGLDVFAGIDVTPVYIRNVDRRKANQCHLVNTLAGITFPGSTLANYLQNLIVTQKLPMVAYQESTMSGIWICPNMARSRGILKRKHGIDFTKSYLPKNKKKPFVDSRGYYLWFLSKNAEVLFSGPWALARNCVYDETSSAPIFEHAYVRKWVVWYPHDGTPDHLYWWSDQLTSP